MLHKASIVTGIAAAAALVAAPMAQAHISGGNGKPYGSGKPYVQQDTDFSNNNFNTGDQYCQNSQNSEGGQMGTVLGAVTETLAPVLGVPGIQGGNQGQVLSPQTNACINGSNGSSSAVQF